MKGGRIVLVETFAEKIASHLAEKVRNILISRGKSKAISVYNQKTEEYLLKQYIENLDEQLLARYGNELLYDDLCRVLLEKNNLEYIIDRCRNRNILDLETEQEFLDTVMNELKVKIYNQKTIKEILKHLLNVTFKCFNNLADPENIMLKNIVQYDGDRTRDYISGVRQTTDKILKNMDQLSEEFYALKEEVSSHFNQRGSGEHWNELGRLSSEDIELISSGEYNVKIEAQYSENYFTVFSEIKISPKTFQFENIEDYISYLRFTGKIGEFEICRFEITDYKGISRQKYEDKSYKGLRIALPELYVKEIELAKMEFAEMKVKVRPNFDYLCFQLENDEGDIIIPEKKYKIERERRDNNVVAHMLDTSSRGQLIVNFHVEIQNDPLKTITTVQVLQRDSKKVSSNIEFCNVMEKIANADGIVARDISDDRIIMKASGTFPLEQEFVDTLQQRRDFYKKLKKLENRFNLQFQVPHKVEQKEIMNVDQIIELLDKGVVKTDNAEITMHQSEIQINSGTINDLIGTKGYVFIWHYQKITIWDVEIPVSEYFKVVNFTDKITLDEHNDIKMFSRSSYIYNEKLAELPQNQIIDNLAKGKMTIMK
ncbi:hypothetical protein [Faecalicatena orotica]|uniref:Uncharacterized protein n=1 Tax=Faecalicatena orotica TaxID=1544 RepID=A0A2Y9BF16_9FIRM|nr:hypothetical protein [Faecalicatena orotica]PWJ28745.1 hypothetical protein A8806_108260 [Faecalicatena orotica]SSA56567.1 hypothetical protein SAMN05216536_108260 [Faecalicatena orotica]